MKIQFTIQYSPIGFSYGFSFFFSLSLFHSNQFVRFLSSLFFIISFSIYNSNIRMIWFDLIRFSIFILSILVNVDNCCHHHHHHHPSHHHGRILHIRFDFRFVEKKTDTFTGTKKNKIHYWFLIFFYIYLCLDMFFFFILFFFVDFFSIKIHLIQNIIRNGFLTGNLSFGMNSMDILPNERNEKWWSKWKWKKEEKFTVIIKIRHCWWMYAIHDFFSLNRTFHNMQMMMMMIQFFFVVVDWLFSLMTTRYNVLN